MKFAASLDPNPHNRTIQFATVVYRAANDVARDEAVTLPGFMTAGALFKGRQIQDFQDAAIRWLESERLGPYESDPLFGKLAQALIGCGSVFVLKQGSDLTLLTSNEEDFFDELLEWLRQVKLKADLFTRRLVAKLEELDRIAA